jgi:hypothetical protein
MSIVLANGQLPNTTTALSTATTTDRVNVLLRNTSGSLQETAQITVKRAGGTARNLPQFILAANESAIIEGLPVESGDIIQGTTTDATTVDYDITGMGQNPIVPVPFAVQCFDKNGNLKVIQTGTVTSGATTITSTSANALAVGPAGTTNPSLNVDASTASAATGLNVKSAAAGSGLALTVISSGGNESLTEDAKGSGTISLGNTSTGLVALGRGSTKQAIQSSTKTSLATQNITPTAAQLLGGYIAHASVTGAGTATLDTAANIDAAISGVTTGDMFNCYYANTGTQTVTITTNTGLSLKGTVAVTTGKNAILSFLRTGAAAWDVVITVSA